MIQYRLCCCLVLLVSPLTHGSVINGDFANGLNGWTTLDDVTAVAQEALVSDNGAGLGIGSSLYQGVGLATGNFELSFDFLGELSSSVPQGLFPDLFSATLYFTDDPNDLISGSYPDFIALFDLESTGLLPPLGGFNGSVGISPTKPGWSRWTVSFFNSYQLAVPTFDTFNLNCDPFSTACTTDSLVRVDNVSITSVPAAVPLPSSLLLLLLGLSAMATRLGKPCSNLSAGPTPAPSRNSDAILPRPFHPSGWG